MAKNCLNPGAGSKGMDDSSILEVDRLQVQFRLEQVTVRAVEDVSFSLRRKNTMGLVGASGCGKSITAMAIMRLIQSPPCKITGGEIRLRRRNGDICDIAALSAKGPAMRSIRGAEIAMIFQEPMTSLNPIYTVGAQIAESVMLHSGCPKRTPWARPWTCSRRWASAPRKPGLNSTPTSFPGGCARGS